MRNKRIEGWALFATILVCAAACGKKDDTPPAPVLSSPQPVEKEPAAEVKASSGPIELSLLLRDTKIKAGGSIWEQIRLRNIGNREIIISDPVFFSARDLLKQSYSRFGIYLEALGPDGKPVPVEAPTPAHMGKDLMEGVSGLLEVDGPKERAMIKAWKRQGLSPQEINAKLLDFNIKKREKASAQSNGQDRNITLMPGQSAETKYSFALNIQDKIHNQPAPRPKGSFTRIDFFVFDIPGEYKIRAVYDHAPTPELNKMRGGLPIYPEEVFVHTPWTKVTVTQ